MKSVILFALTFLIAVPGCSSGQHATRELSERERDSLIARSQLPGAAVVGRAMAVSDRLERQAARQDSAFTNP